MGPDKRLPLTMQRCTLLLLLVEGKSLSLAHLGIFKAVSVALELLKQFLHRRKLSD